MKRFIISLLVLAACFMAHAQKSTFEYKVFTSSDGTDLNYRLLKPSETAKGKKFPLVIFLHGSGGRGDDNEKQMTNGSEMFLNPVNQEKYPAYVLFPQCPKKDFWAYQFKNIDMKFEKPVKAEAVMPPIFKAVKEMIEAYISYPDVDESRVYIMGLSMGGFATFDMIARYPELFAAAVPICGAVDPSRMKDVKGVSIRIYHGDADKVVPVECSRMAYRALREAGADVEYFEFPGCGHGSWNPAFSQPDFMEWLFKQKKARKYMK